MPEWVQRGALLFEVAGALTFRLERAQVRVDQGNLPDVTRPGEGKASRGRYVADEHGRDGIPTAGAGIPGLHDGRDVLVRPAQVERPARDDDEYDGRAGGGDALQLLELASGQVERRGGCLLARLVLPLPHHDDGDVGGCRDLDGPRDLRVVIPIGGSRGDRGVGAVELRWEQSLRDAGARRVGDGHAAADGSGARRGW